MRFSKETMCQASDSEEEEEEAQERCKASKAECKAPDLEDCLPRL